MDDKQLYEAIRLFVPASFNTIDGFIQYFKTRAVTSVKRIDLYRMSIEIKKDGISLMDFEPHKTEIYEFTYRSLKDFLYKNWPHKTDFNLKNQTSLFEGQQIQLNTAF